MDKERIVEGIKERIISEHKKHSGLLDWAHIAALKIYATYDIKLKEVPKEDPSIAK
jgi:hypothetical protein